MNNHTEDKDGFYRKSVPLAKMYVDEFLTNTIHNNAIQSCIDVVREMLDAADLVDDRMSLNTLNELEEKLQSLKK